MILWMSVGTMDAQAETLKAIIEIQQQIEGLTNQIAVLSSTVVNIQHMVDPAPLMEITPAMLLVTKSTGGAFGCI